MASISDIIEKFIKNLMKDSDNIQIQRNELANLFNCAPSQINYVLTTRFSREKGYEILSKKGGGGYVEIKKIKTIKTNTREHVLHTIYEKIDNKITYFQGKVIINWLLDINIINNKEAKIILCVIDDKSLNTPIYELSENIRAKILKNIIEELFNIEE
ncbi:CtsR family transcriptional regulator [Terrisporobacter sp.]|uniref:CtsR family transcriptional regulator n=1 Tax=Terrisporobacter sp. TaxID=1965305 RepID=UPI002606FC38|nr:CtsR family transcriptional regulator [Terrisporobacter sp.]